MFVHQADFRFASLFERYWRAIRAEVSDIPRADFVPVITPCAQGGDWLIFPLIADTHDPLYKSPDILQANQARCPCTVQLAREVPGLSSLAFTRMAPGTRIERHVDQLAPPAWRFQLGLVTNPENRLRCGQDTLRWQEGQAIIFDPQRTHDADNRGGSDHIVLRLDVVKSRYNPRPITPRRVAQ